MTQVVQYEGEPRSGRGPAWRTPMMRALTNVKPTGIYSLSYVASVLDVTPPSHERDVRAAKPSAVRTGRHSFTTGRSSLAWLERNTDGKGKRKPEETPT